MKERRSVIDKYIDDVQFSLNKPEKSLSSSVREIEQFVTSRPWQDFKTILLENIDYLRQELETKEGIDEIRLIQGGIAELKRVLLLPNVAIESIKLEKHINETKEEIGTEGDNNG